MPKQVCLYPRVSKTSQSVERQISELKIVADRNNWKIVDRFIDHGISGAKGRQDRPELDRLMKDSTKRKFDIVMAWSIDRLGRSLQNLMEILNDLNAKKIDLYFDQQSIDTTTPTGSLMFSILGAFSQFEREMIRERVISGLGNARKKGRIGGRPTNLTNEIRTRILELKAAGATIRKIKEERAVGTATIYEVIRGGNSVLGVPGV